MRDGHVATRHHPQQCQVGQHCIFASHKFVVVQDGPHDQASCLVKVCNPPDQCPRLLLPAASAAEGAQQMSLGAACGVAYASLVTSEAHFVCMRSWAL